ncbi:MAG: TetR/AcrR family transcriptional regulator [Anaerolineae bacterium]|nr:TetR/AcrR family transcriptional regulator [Anaerolineae bacterium]
MPEEKLASGRQRILDQAQRLFSARGYHGVSIRDIARACELSNAVLYYHFGSKRNLYFEVLREHISTLSHHLREAGEIAGSCRERLANMARAYAQMILEYQDTVQLLLRDLAQFDWEEVMQMLPDLETQMPSAVAKVLEQGIASGEVRTLDVHRVDMLLLGMISSLVALRARQPGMTTILDEDVGLVIDVLFEGIKPPSTTAKDKGDVSA